MAVDIILLDLPAFVLFGTDAVHFCKVNDLWRKMRISCSRLAVESIYWFESKKL
jgi:hypothetical protein